MVKYGHERHKCNVRVCCWRDGCVCIELVPSLSDKIPTHTHSENRPAVITTSPSAVVIATSGTTVAGIMLAD